MSLNLISTVFYISSFFEVLYVYNPSLFLFKYYILYALK